MNFNSPVTDLEGIGPHYAKILRKLNISKVGDLLLHKPSKYIDLRKVTEINKCKAGNLVTVKGQITGSNMLRSKRGVDIQIFDIEDSTGKLSLVFFNQKFIFSSLKKGVQVSAAGKIEFFGRKLAIFNPFYEISNLKSSKMNLHTGRLVPIYPETKGIGSKWLRAKITDAFERIKDKIEDPLLPEDIKTYRLVSFTDAIGGIHFPQSQVDVKKAIERLSFGEILNITLASRLRKQKWIEISPVNKIKIDSGYIQEFKNLLPFKLTSSQENSIIEIYSDLKNPTKPMNRLLEGDVGSGKTVVAASAIYAAYKNNLKSAVMAPTQILAKQHFDTLKNIFFKTGIKLKLITSQGKEGGLEGEDVYVGTHALIYNKSEIKNVSLNIIDEQHKFGVEQRSLLIRKGKEAKTAAHILTMTATPIPRTIAMVAYSDLELSVLKELPQGRIPIKTWVVPPKKRSSSYEWIKKKIKETNSQVYVICPLIEESEYEMLSSLKAVTTEYKKIKKEFSGFSVGLLHGRLKNDEKTEILRQFKNDKLDILVSTPVVEVGIDAPNATIMLIEDAQRYGLAQLHQLRGRVGRGNKQSFCLLYTENPTTSALTRLNALKKNLTGFELAELDLKLRGPGELLGTLQHGFAKLNFADWNNKKMIEDAKSLTEKITNNKNLYKNLIKEVELKIDYLN
jgi:ATP-dependent DNA helicase RecG